MRRQGAWAVVRGVVLGAVLLWGAGAAWGQAIFPGGAVVGGVKIDADGTVRHRQVEGKELATLRQRAQNAATVKEQGLAYISLPKVLAEARALIKENKPLPEQMRYLGGMTQLRYVFVYPEQKDLVIAGPWEAIDAANPLAPVGQKTGRPVLQLEDLVTALRTVSRPEGMRFIGCTIDNPPNSQQTSDAVAKQYSNRPTAELTAAMVQAIGPQTVHILGTADDTRFATALIVADFRLKRLCLGLDATTAPGLGSAFGATRELSEFWFETAYEPLLVSAEGDAFGFRGPRLTLKAGPQKFQEKGVSGAATAFAKRFNEKFPALVANVPAFADLQNVTDLALLAALIRTDKLDEKVGWDAAWVLDAQAFPVATLPAPKSAETLVSVSSGAVASGGVAIRLADLVKASARAADTGKTLAAFRGRPEGSRWVMQAGSLQTSEAPKGPTTAPRP